MTLILLVFAALIVALQIALTFTLKRMLDLLAATRDEVHGLQLRVQTLEHERDAATPPPSALFTLMPRADAPATAPTPSPPPEPPPAPSPAEPIDLPVLHEPVAAISTDAVGAQVRALARQGMPVREIAERCGLSEAEAELIIHLRQEPV
ncbi:conserved exported hypothetical protein [Thiomonas arsenitoxydans]|uniref:DUF2802 domain-containing protein n=1 Tax=Thiomonas arsenitoxydans (strain DSM 22701 / CIP 110005 / 3As) TaxID=426114 RepID=D6CQ93_THIA3|nr:DUF2802 domain-containing protein [Thiomonas arsenitoxydans]CAZ88173.1 hypothetical protein; putative exported protein [Thiomonas arsenitoxydans]CQR32589.1 conserved exported hypothetical protein [Thiomonas arsenitoxydans]CQR32926.1 conserved exported hypothetical protein [Thiomonas arsenitoxydans]CQR34060.1 conserved exported hypothetical protein [Thiomonas arsenitoxydans]CQR40359.1 conserved exported hypothetical protein [Thiomonas arsenitoxydans]